MNNFTNFLNHLNSFGSHKLFHSGRLNEQDGPIEPPPTETPPLRSGIDKYKYGDDGLRGWKNPITAPTATPPDDSYDQDGPIEPPRTEEPEPFVGPPSPQSNKPSISPSPRSRRDNWNEDPYFKDAETVQGVNDANGVVAPTGKPNTTHFMKSMPFYPAKEKKSSPYKNGQFIDPIKDTINGVPNSEMDHLKLNETSNHNIFLNHLNSFPKNKNQLNEINTSGRYWTPDGPGPDRAPPANPLALNYFPPDMGKVNSVSGKPNMQRNEAQQEFLRHIISSHKHVPFEELHKKRFNDLPHEEREIKRQQLASAYNVATGEDANEDTLMLAAAHNDPAIREAAHNNVNATDNVRGVALWHDLIQDQTEADLRSGGIDPADLSKHRSHPQIQRLKAKITDRMIDLRSHLATAINNGHNLLELYKQHLRGEDPEKEQRERGGGPYDTPDRMN